MDTVVLAEYYMVLCYSTGDQDGEEDEGEGHVVRHPHHHHTHNTRLDTAVLKGWADLGRLGCYSAHFC